ncbi:hypothetical protein [Methylocystis echinoides]|uniref:Uncharacterized protein n=1 Tax=Methylocystis echinoides TaxID=29468 RepID=A0A9W6GSQ6_9HYPH|nr:hypothetical protein [Methylocystis echinoides]GLI92324.1 hypothetical protein LMG27198_13160 [Methylocystis echinoides]
MSTELTTRGGGRRMGTDISTAAKAASKNLLARMLSADEDIVVVQASARRP